MFDTSHHVSLITAVLPNPSVDLVVEDLVKEKNINVLVSQARGSLLQEHWWKSWLPSISPSKTMLRMIVPAQDVDQVVGSVVVNARLHQQALGAVREIRFVRLQRTNHRRKRNGRIVWRFHLRPPKPADSRCSGVSK